ncbi:hypothetical protein AMECASPLE_023385 [Ameca splendens]|uniref:Uncharacterized protein n=1 Tax=Ameca splendens TaxID=208324 RepID=A0ABV0ZNY8_9TELE
MLGTMNNVSQVKSGAKFSQDMMLRFQPKMFYFCFITKDNFVSLGLTQSLRCILAKPQAGSHARLATLIIKAGLVESTMVDILDGFPIYTREHCSSALLTDMQCSHIS